MIKLELQPLGVAEFHSEGEIQILPLTILSLQVVCICELGMIRLKDKFKKRIVPTEPMHFRIPLVLHLYLGDSKYSRTSRVYIIVLIRVHIA